MKDTTPSIVNTCFLNNWVFPNVIPNSILTGKDTLFIAQFFRYECAIL